MNPSCKITLIFAGFFALALLVAADTESDIRNKLGIPPEAKRVIILSQSSHMDWDWLETFPGYYNSEVNEILLQATQVMLNHSDQPVPYYYSVAETGFLQRFWQTHPNKLADLRKVGDKLRMVGGGITSPDNLLNHGEALIRTYLVGQGYLRNVSLPTFTNAWIPDDFGHDGQLPVVIRAMGLKAAAFARVPGAGNQGPAAKRLDGLPTTADLLMKQGVTFKWKASDGSSFLAHWLQAHYNQGDEIDKGTSGTPTNCNSYSTAPNMQITNSQIASYVAANSPTSVSPYMFVAIGDDFKRPKPCLLTYIRNWNTHVYGKQTSFPSDVWAVSATFDHYAGLVESHTSNPSNNRPLRSEAFQPTPYWTGFYTSRPTMKILHELAIRKLMTAETTTYFLQDGSARSRLQHGWDRLTPSTHHDFVTGTSPDKVYLEEQVPYLEEAVRTGDGLQTAHLTKIAAFLTSDATTSEAGFMVFNSLGFERTSPILLPTKALPDAKSYFDGRHHHPIQHLVDGSTLSLAWTPSLGYSLGKLTKKAAEPSPTAHLKTDGPIVTLSNPFVNIVISETSGWNVISIIDNVNGKELISSSSKDSGGFNLEIVEDHGNIYRFGNEMPSCTFGGKTTSWSTLPIDFSKIEGGNVRVSVPTVVVANYNGQSYNFTRVYTLYAHEHMVRVSVTGQAPKDTSVFMRSPLTVNQPRISYGTPYHWDTFTPPRYWSGYNFLVAHNHFAVTSIEGLNIAFYSSTVRAWTLDENVVVASLFRNTPGGGCNGYGADGSDSGIHTHHLALRTAAYFRPAPSMIPLMESLSFSTPALPEIVARRGPTSSNIYSIASAQPSEFAIITTAKPSEEDIRKLVLRAYSSSAGSSSPIEYTISTTAPFRQVEVVSALENPIPTNEQPAKVRISASTQFAVSQSAALATFRIV